MIRHRAGGHDRVMTDERPTGRFVPAMLILLSAVPVVAGAARLTELTGGAEITPENARFFAVPLPVVLHIVSVSVYSVLGAFQFAPGFRRRRPGWHRAAGRVLVPSGLVAALTGLWMTVFYPYPAGGSDLLSGIRLVFGTAMALSIVLGFAAIRRRDVVRHRAWMIRGYAIGLGAGTQVLTHLPWVLVFGAPGEVATALLMAAGWVINVAVAEWAVRRRPAVRTVRLGS
ncbi:membrane protein [Planomonospora parontospora]|uniref:Membrane protein n=2 Tax=Planomonospora parontospora TaxID=58119 RepID=A0AA37F7R0_9ACTN|nr:membrane protein [Planomonospora parontospora]